MFSAVNTNLTYIIFHPVQESRFKAILCAVDAWKWTSMLAHYYVVISTATSVETN